jgi:hypothetical protein
MLGLARPSRTPFVVSARSSIRGFTAKLTRLEVPPKEGVHRRSNVRSHSEGSKDRGERDELIEAQ